MPSLGPAEILVILVVALLVFGPDKMPDMARQAGRAFKEFRRVQQHLRSEISGALNDDTPAAAAGDASGAAPSTTAAGGDPVPMLPPKDAPSLQPDAQPPPPGATGPAAGAGQAAPATPPAPVEPGPDTPGPGAPGEPA